MLELAMVLVKVKTWQVEADNLIRLFRMFIPYRSKYGMELGFEKFFEDNEQFCLASGIDAVEDVLLHEWVGKRRWANGHRSRYVKSEHSTQEWEVKLRQYNFRCAYCKQTSNKLTKDHVIPISKGGSDKIENIVPACWHCNYSKRDRDVKIWLSQ